VRQAIKIPLAVKLSPFYTSMSHLAKALDELEVNGLVLFNRFLQPDISLDDLRLHSELHFSTPEELKVPLRWTAILHGRIKAEIAMTTGVHMGKDAAKSILAGAQVVQVASVLYQNGLEHLQKMNADLERWMNHHDFATIEDFRGKLSQQHVPDPQAFERAQYVRLLMSES
jgi:dihydroorotate dehydrogenase (fumarate)